MKTLLLIRFPLVLNRFKPLAFGLALGACLWGGAALAEEEAKSLTARLLAPPKLTAETGFSVKLLVPPGHLYDPLWMLPRGDVVWINDDGGEEGEKGSRLLSLDAKGKISVLAGLGKLLPVTGFDVAPVGFGSFAGQIFSLAQAKVAAAGATANHIIQRIDPQKDYEASVFCTLPTAGSTNKGVSGFGVDARFGPEGSPFAGKFYAVTAFNNAIYQVTPDGSCSPFVLFEGKNDGAPTGLSFSRDGKSMLVTLVKGEIVGASTGKNGRIVAVTADGKIAEKPLVEGLSRPMGMDIAPESFGKYANQIFVADVDDIQAPVPMTQALKADGKIYRVADGALHPVASGFLNPAGVRFIDGKVWSSDISGDFIAGKRELPDGFIAELRAE